MNHVEYEIKQAEQLIGGKISGIIHDKVNNSFGLRIQFRGGKSSHAWVDCDPEGNGPGHLHIESIKKGQEK